MKPILLSLVLISSTMLAQGTPTSTKKVEEPKEVNKQETLNAAIKHFSFAINTMAKAKESLNLVQYDLYCSSEDIWRDGISDLVVACKELDACNERLVLVLLGTDWDSKPSKVKELAIISDHLFVEASEVFSNASRIYGAKCVDNANPVERKRTISLVSEALMLSVNTKIESIRLKVKLISNLYPKLNLPSINPSVANP